jgi:hypothetical protein
MFVILMVCEISCLHIITRIRQKVSLCPVLFLHFTVDIIEDNGRLKTTHLEAV